MFTVIEIVDSCALSKRDFQTMQEVNGAPEPVSGKGKGSPRLFDFNALCVFVLAAKLARAGMPLTVATRTSIALVARWVSDRGEFPIASGDLSRKVKDFDELPRLGERVSPIALIAACIDQGIVSKEPGTLPSDLEILLIKSTADHMHVFSRPANRLPFIDAPVEPEIVISGIGRSAKHPPRVRTFEEIYASNVESGEDQDTIAKVFFDRADSYVAVNASLAIRRALAAIVLRRVSA